MIEKYNDDGQYALIEKFTLDSISCVETKGLYTYLASMPCGFDINAAHIQKHFTLSRYKYDILIGNLIDLCLVHKYKSYKGVIEKCTYVLQVVPTKQVTFTIKSVDKKNLIHKIDASHKATSYIARLPISVLQGVKDAQALGVWCHIATMPESFDINPNQLSKQLDIYVRRIRPIIRMLNILGLIEDTEYGLKSTISINTYANNNSHDLEKAPHDTKLRNSIDKSESCNGISSLSDMKIAPFQHREPISTISHDLEKAPHDTKIAPFQQVIYPTLIGTTTYPKDTSSSSSYDLIKSDSPKTPSSPLRGVGVCDSHDEGSPEPNEPSVADLMKSLSQESRDSLRTHGKQDAEQLAQSHHTYKTIDELLKGISTLTTALTVPTDASCDASAIFATMSQQQHEPPRIVLRTDTLDQLQLQLQALT